MVNDDTFLEPVIVHRRALSNITNSSKTPNSKRKARQSTPRVGFVREKLQVFEDDIAKKPTVWKTVSSNTIRVTPAFDGKKTISKTLMANKQSNQKRKREDKPALQPALQPVAPAICKLVFNDQEKPEINQEILKNELTQAKTELESFKQATAESKAKIQELIGQAEVEKKKRDGEHNTAELMKIDELLKELKNDCDKVSLQREHSSPSTKENQNPKKYSMFGIFKKAVFGAKTAAEQPKIERTRLDKIKDVQSCLQGLIKENQQLVSKIEIGEQELKGLVNNQIGGKATVSLLTELNSNNEKLAVLTRKLNLTKQRLKIVTEEASASQENIAQLVQLLEERDDEVFKEKISNLKKIVATKDEEISEWKKRSDDLRARLRTEKKYSRKCLEKMNAAKNELEDTQEKLADRYVCSERISNKLTNFYESQKAARQQIDQLMNGMQTRLDDIMHDQEKASKRRRTDLIKSPQTFTARESVNSQTFSC